MELSDIKLHYIETWDDAQAFLRWLGNRREYLGFDTESTGLHLKRDYLKLIQFGDHQEGWAMPLNRWGGLAQEAFDRYTGEYTAHNITNDMAVMEAAGFRIPPWRLMNDSFIAAKLHDNQEPNCKLKVLGDKYVHPNFSQGEKRKNADMTKMGYHWGNVPEDFPPYWMYGALDAVGHSVLMSTLGPQSKELYPHAWDLEMGVARVLKNMTLKGVLLDKEYAERTLEEQQELQDRLHKELRDLHIDHGSGGKDTILSYFNKHEIRVPVKIKKKTGQTSIDDDVLSNISTGEVDKDGFPVQHPVAKLIQDAREVDKNIKSYLLKLLDSVDSEGRVHTHVNQLEARTHRMSCTDPPLHQLSKTALIRDCIIASPDHKILLVDYANQELRIIGSLCGDHNIIKAFKEGLDLHRQTASRMYGVAMEDVSDKQKTAAKRGSFTYAYGGGAATFATYMGLGYEVGQRYFDTLVMAYPRIREYIEEQKAVIKANKTGDFGYIHVSDGRRLNIRADRSFTAVSYGSQCEASILLKEKLIELDAAGLGQYLRIPIHDENFMEVSAADLKDVQPEVERIMESDKFTIHLPVESTVVERWGDEYAKNADGSYAPWDPELRRRVYVDAA